MKLYWAILFLLVCNSCRSDYDFGIDTNPKPIVNCLFHPDSIWRIEITRSPASLWKYHFAPIEGATVRISLNSQNPLLLDQFVSKDLGFYTSSAENVPSAPFETVRLEVITEENTVTATSYIPPKPLFSKEILDLIATKREHRPKNGRFDWDIEGKIHLKIDTRKNGHVWYSIVVRYRSNMIYGSPGRIYSNDPDTTIFDYLRLDIPYPDAFKTLRKTDGYCIDLSAYDPEMDELILNVQGDVDNLPGDLDFIVLTVASITEEYLMYNKKVIAQYVAGQDLFSEPVSVYSNIKGGLGIFSGINSVTDTIRFH
ncbi:MAG: DUF4249 family protein [Bacteroidales bacterium]